MTKKGQRDTKPKPTTAGKLLPVSLHEIRPLEAKRTSKPELPSGPGNRAA